MNPIFDAFSALIKPVSDIAGGWMKKKQIEAQGKVEIAKATVEAKVKRIQSNEQMDGRLEELSIETRGWKDEYLLLITTTPLILCFFPSMVAAIQAGFAAIASLPQYYWYALGMIYVDTFGFRRMIRLWLDNKVKVL